MTKENANSESTQSVATTKRRSVLGVVISTKMNKTIVVQSESLKKHLKYGKYYQRYKKYKAHDERAECEVGDRVLIIESRPISKQKHFRLQKIVEKVKKAV